MCCPGPQRTAKFAKHGFPVHEFHELPRWQFGRDEIDAVVSRSRHGGVALRVPCRQTRLCLLAEQIAFHARPRVETVEQIRFSRHRLLTLARACTRNDLSLANECFAICTWVVLE